MDGDWAFVPAAEIARRVAAGEASAAEVAEATLARIERIDPGIGAFLTVTADLAIEQAKAVDARIASGSSPAPLAGVPISLKDLTAVGGVRATFGSRLLADFVAPFDEHFVERLRTDGLVFTGKTNTSEFGATPFTDNEIAPATRNPWDPSRTAGGSSGGACAAVAAGLGPIAEGSDAAGSIRIPSACCGVVGLKPSRGRVSFAPVYGEAWAGVAVTGPIARTVEDAAFLLDAMAGPATGDPYWAAPPPVPFRESVRREPPRLRIAMAVDADDAPADPQVRAAVERAAGTLEAAGHTIEPGCPSFAGMSEALDTIYAVSMASLPFDLGGVKVEPEKLTPFVRICWERGKATPADVYARAVWTMHLLSRGVVGFFDQYDVLLTPTLQRTAPALGWFPEPIDRAYEDFYRWFPFTYPFNMTGQPAISIPGGWTSEGLPIGIQLVGRPADEVTILSLAAQLERAAPWKDRIPPVARG